MSRELASPWLANLIAARLPPDEFDRRSRAPLSEAEAEEIAELVDWFTRRYPTALDRLAYARRKMRDYRRAGLDAPAAPAGYRETATRLARAHRQADPETLDVLLDPDPEAREIRLVEVTRKAPSASEPLAVGFVARPDLGVPFPCAVILLSPEDWDATRAGELGLPHPFEVSRLEAL